MKLFCSYDDQLSTKCLLKKNYYQANIPCSGSIQIVAHQKQKGNHTLNQANNIRPIPVRKLCLGSGWYLKGIGPSGWQLKWSVRVNQVLAKEKIQCLPLWDPWDWCVAISSKKFQGWVKMPWDFQLNIPPCGLWPIWILAHQKQKGNHNPTQRTRRRGRRALTTPLTRTTEECIVFPWGCTGVEGYTIWDRCSEYCDLCKERDNE